MVSAGVIINPHGNNAAADLSTDVFFDLSRSFFGRG